MKQSREVKHGRLPDVAAVMFAVLMALAWPEARAADSAVGAQASGGASTTAGAPASQTAAATTPTQPEAIAGLGKKGRDQTATPTLEMGDDLLVRLDGTAPLKAADWTLYLNGHEITDLATSTVVDDSEHGLVFKLRRTDKNKANWDEILGSPPLSGRDVTVAIGHAGAKDAPLLKTRDGDPAAVFRLDILMTIWLVVAALVALAVLVLFAGVAAKTSILRDDFLSQIPVRQRNFSLGRCQMAFWFVLVAVSFLFLWALLWDYNTINAQALTLMGISVATGLGALMANTSKSEAVSAADKELRAAGFNTPEDIESKIAQRKAAKDNRKIQSGSPAAVAALDAEILSLTAAIDTYRAKAKDFVTATYDFDTDQYRYGQFFRDLVADGSGPTLHRLQLVCWTIILGVVFVVGIYRDLTMPEFSGTLLALMAVTSAGYVGFKFPEKV